MTIFVSVAAYRDPELVPTVLDCLAKARRPAEVRLAVCWQHLGDEDTSALVADARVHLIDRDARDSRGAGWARAQLMAEYAGEDWYLQIDSHTRFAPGWDSRLIHLAGRTGAAKPVITGYPASYDPAEPSARGDVPAETFVDRWSHDGLPIFAQRTIAGWAQLDGPVPARFVAAGFLFAPGSFAREVAYDPGIYFQGEEATLSARAFTWGYDLFHPAEVLSWHYYIRPDSPRHWSDHAGGPGRRSWYDLDRASRRRATTILRYPSVGRLAMGPHRTMATYQAYAGIDFLARTHDQTPSASALR